MTTQRELLLLHFRTHGPISALVARGLYRIESLSSRMAELKKEGKAVKREMRVDATGRRYAVYWVGRKGR